MKKKKEKKNFKDEFPEFWMIIFFLSWPADYILTISVQHLLFSYFVVRVDSSFFFRIHFGC